MYTRFPALRPQDRITRYRLHPNGRRESLFYFSRSRAFHPSSLSLSLLLHRVSPFFRGRLSFVNDHTLINRSVARIKMPAILFAAQHASALESETRQQRKRWYLSGPIRSTSRYQRTLVRCIQTWWSVAAVVCARASKVHHPEVRGNLTKIPDKLIFTGLC